MPMLSQPKLVCSDQLKLTSNTHIKTMKTRIANKVTCSTSVVHNVRQQLVNKSSSAQELVRQYLQRAKSVEPSIGSFITIDEEGAMRQAEALDKQLQQGATPGPLAGIPVAVKDNICTRGVLTTAGSQILSNYIPPYNATVVERLQAAGAIVIGKTNMDEFGMGSSTENSSYHVTRNPWDTSRVPGGSSGGAASAVSANQCVASLGTDTGGSIRQPAHFCGVVGVKPTYGRVSRYGLISYASSLDTIGPLAASVADAAEVFSVIAGHDAADATASRHPVDNYLRGIVDVQSLGESKPLQGKKFALIKETLGEGVDAGVSAAIAAAATHLQSLGATVEEVSLPTFAIGLPAYYVIALSEASSNLARYDGVRYGIRTDAKDTVGMYTSSRGNGLGDEVKRRILMGTYSLSAGYYDAYYKRALQVRTLIRQEMAESLGKYDALLTPVAPTVAYKIGEKTSDPLAMYKGDLMTVNLNLAGLPAVTLPCGFADGGGVKLPVGLQMIGRAFGEADLFGLAHVFEQTLGLNAVATVRAT